MGICFGQDEAQAALPTGGKQVPMELFDRDDSPVLSSRELEVLRHIGSGFSAKEIARSIDLSPRTVQHHVENIRLKLRARNTAHAITKAMAYGIMPQLS